MKSKTCPICHAPIPENAPGGLCPACVLRDAEETAPVGRGAPSIEKISAAFPQWEILELIGALKILSPELGRDPAFAERFAREARTLGKCSEIPNREGIIHLDVMFEEPAGKPERKRGYRFLGEEGHLSQFVRSDRMGQPFRSSC